MKYLFLVILLTGITGCASTTTQLKEEPVTGTSIVKDYPEDEVLQHVITASIYESQGDFLHALTEYNQALLYDSTDAEIYLAIAEMYERIGQYESAIRVLERGSAAADLKNEILMIKGEIEFQSQDLEAAAKSFSKLAELEPDDSETWSNLAYIYERLGKPLEAVACYEELKRLKPAERESLLGRQGTLLTSAGQYQDAIDTYSELYRLRPSAHILPFLIGGLNLDIGDTTKAEEYFHEATELAPNEPRYWDLRIRLEIIRRHKDNALRLTEKTVNLNPESSDILSLAGSVYMNYDLLDKAEEVLTKAVDIDSSNVLNLLNLGYLFHELKQWDNAERVYLKAMSVAPEEVQVLNNYAYMLAEAGYKLEDALSMVTKALDIAPDNASYLDTKGWILYKLNNYEESEQFLLRAEELDDSNYEILQHLGELYYLMGQFENAEEYFKEAIKYGADEETIRKKMGKNIE